MNRTFLSVAIAVLLAAFVGFVWWVYIAVAGKLHISVPVLVTVAPLIIAAAVWFWQRRAARLQASALERALFADGAKDQRANGARRAEVERLRAEFDRAVTALKGSKLGAGQRDGKDALYRLPWYTIIGPSAAGKTTALQRSGLKFPYVPGTGDRLKGVGGTRNCDWWLTNQGILLDTAGRWTLEDEDKDEWLAFLDLLKRHRGKRPLNGVIAAISVAGDEETSIAGVDLEGVKRLATRMRERLDELSGRLGLSLPVYLVFTKCDLIPGFVETFCDLSPSARAQVWGFTRALSTSSRASAREYFGEEFATLRASLESYVLHRLNDEVSPAAMPVIYEFPAQFGALQKKLELFVDELFEESAFGETPPLRGVYFTSGTQEGAPADLLVDQLSEGLQLRPPVLEGAGTKNSYFVRDLLTNVVFKDRQLATASESTVLKQRRQRRLLTSGMFGSALVISLLPTLSCLQSTKQLSHTNEVVAKVGVGSASGELPSSDALHQLTALQQEIEQYGGSPSVLALFGLHHGHVLRGPLDGLYETALKEQVARPLVRRANARFITMAQQLQGARAQGGKRVVPDERSRKELRNALKLHLLLTQRREKCVPSLEASEAWLVAQLAALWKKADANASADELATRKALLESYLRRASRAEGALLFERDEHSIALIRPALTSDDGVERALSSVLDRHAEEGRTLSDLVGASTVLQSSGTVHGAFTVDAWNEVARPMGSSEGFQPDEESWVMGCDVARAADVRSAEQRRGFERRYLQELRKTWTQFIASLSVRSPASAPEAELMLTELVGRPGVLGRLFEAVRTHTVLPAPVAPEDTLLKAAASVTDKAVKADKKGKRALEELRPPPNPALRELERAFADFAGFGASAEPGKETPLEQYRRQLEVVLTALKSYRVDQSKLPELSVATRGALDTTDLLLRNHAGTWSDRLRSLLVPPLEALSHVVVQERARAIERSFCELVHRPFQEQLAGRYPFSREAADGASLQAFQSFFAPGAGAIWSFYDSQLRGLVTLQGGRFTFDQARGAETRAMLRDELVAFLNRSLQVRRAFFPSDSATVRMPFRIRVIGAPGYSVTTFRTGTVSVRYDSSGESWTAAEWPGEQASLGATLSVTPYEGAGPRPMTMAGEWGLFRLLDEQAGGYVLERASRQITVGWKPKGGQHWIKVDFATDDAKSPLLSVPLGGAPSNLFPIHPPSHIAHEGEGC